MSISRQQRISEKRVTGGFALIVSLVLMAFTLLVITSLTTFLKTGQQNIGDQQVQLRADLSAQFALKIALGQLQTELGDDRRVTATADLPFPSSSTRPGLVGVWDSAPNPWIVDPSTRAPNYSRQKERAFRRWLISGPTDQVTDDLAFAETRPNPEEPILFSHPTEPISAPSVTLSDTDSFAWAVTDEGLKARVNIGEDPGTRPTASTITAPAGPNVSLSSLIQQPSADWADRTARINRFSQIALDPAFASAAPPEEIARSYTTVSRSLLSDVTNGGLKIDLSLAFEMSDLNFQRTQWGPFPNPFRGGIAPGGEVPLFQPANSAQPPTITVDYDGRANETRTFNTGGVPTFDHLRSHYRLPREMGSSGSSISIRPMTSRWWDPFTPSSGGVTPVLNRVLFFFSPWIDPSDPSTMRILLTPVIVLWNPYDVPIESTAYFAYQRLDIPVRFRFSVDPADPAKPGYSWGEYLGGFLGRGLPTSPTSGRSLEPYFLMQITQLGTNSIRRPIVIGPGEVRLFGPAASVPTEYPRTGTEGQRTLRMKPVNAPDDLNFEGGFAIRLDHGISNSPSYNWSYPLVDPNDRIDITGNFARDRFHYMITLENGGRLDRNLEPEILSEVMVYRGVGSDSNEQIINFPTFDASELNTPRPVAVLETFNRTAAQPGSLSNILFTVNPRQRFVNSLLSSADFTSGPHYQTDFREVSDFLGSGLQITPDAQRTYYGPTNEPAQGRDRLSVLEIPTRPILSLGQFQHADLADTAFAPANPAGNSWASPYVPDRDTFVLMTQAASGSREAISPSLALYDHSFLINHALWDRFFFSSIADGTDNGHTSLISPWLADPSAAPLSNPRHLPALGTRPTSEIEARLTGEARALYAASHLFLEGGFNINSTSEEAWRSVLSSLRDTKLNIRRADPNQLDYVYESGYSFYRHSLPIGEPNDPWVGFRELSDDEIRALARELVAEIRQRGPFQSLGEFVNRQLSREDTSRKGALQAAIDEAGINRAVRIERFDTAAYPEPGNLPDNFTGVGIPGWLTQADVLTSIGPILTARSDTFTIRTEGRSFNPVNSESTTVLLEATVQRVPVWVDSSQDEVLPVTSINSINTALGRRFVITDLRRLTR